MAHKFFIDQIVITPNKMPAFIVMTYGNGTIYEVNEMPTQIDLESESNEIDNNLKMYPEKELRLATEEECKILGEYQPLLKTDIVH